MRDRGLENLNGVPIKHLELLLRGWAASVDINEALLHAARLWIAHVATVNHDVGRLLVVLLLTVVVQSLVDERRGFRRVA